MPGVAVIFLEANTQQNQALSIARQQALEVTRQVTFSQQEIIRKTRSYLANLTLAEQLQNPTTEQCSEFLTSILLLNDLFVNIGVPSPDGRLLCNALPLSKKVNVYDRAYFQKLLPHGALP